jgi:hypothetical protein
MCVIIYVGHHTYLYVLIGNGQQSAGSDFVAKISAPNSWKDGADKTIYLKDENGKRLVMPKAIIC